MSHTDTEQSLAMSTEGDRVRARRERIGIDKKALAEEAGVSRDTLAAIEAGEGFRRSSLTKIERVLDRLEEEIGFDAPPQTSTESGLMEFEVSGDFGVRVVVRGPVADAEALEQSVARLVRDIRNKDTESDST